MKKSFEDFRHQSLDPSQLKRIKGGGISCNCVYTGTGGVGWDELNGSCASNSATTCATQGANKYPNMRGTCQCHEE